MNFRAAASRRFFASLQGWTSRRKAKSGLGMVNALPARSSDIAMVFQSRALYPHRSCYENLALNLVLKKTPRDEIVRRVHDTAQLLQIEDLLEKTPRQLSGCQRQRVAAGRALIRNPKVFLFDEPLSNLDAILREKVRHELKGLFPRLRAAVVYVTHNQVGKPTTLADRTIMLDRGRDPADRQSRRAL